jgi:hypothetical protein
MLPELVQAGEAHEGQAHQAGGDHGDGVPRKASARRRLQALADAGEQDQRQGEADGAAEAEQQRLEEVVAQATLSRGTPSTAQLVVISGR